MAALPRRTCAGKRTGGLRPWQKGADKRLVPHRNGGSFATLSPLTSDLLWCRRLRRPELSSSSDLRLARVAAMAALVAALGLAGCGRKSGLDPPPGATAADNSVSRPDLEPATRPDGKAIAGPQGPKRRTPINRLLNRARAVHSFVYRPGVLHAGSVNFVHLAQAVPAPFYCSSSATLSRHYEVFADAFADVKALICYAMKANSNQAVINTLAALGAGADVVSEGELTRARTAGIPPANPLSSGI